jgi:hypothetical protein
MPQRPTITFIDSTRSILYLHILYYSQYVYAHSECCQLRVINGLSILHVVGALTPL